MKPKRTIIAITGVISTIIGITFGVSSILQNDILASSIFSLLIILGLIMIAYALGE